MNRFRAILFSSVSVIFLLFSVSPVEGKSFKKLKKLHLEANSCWKNELKNKLKDLSLDPVPSLVSDSRCSIDIQGENLLEKLCESYLSDENLKAMSTTIRLAMGLRCLSQTEIVMLSKGMQEYMEALTEKGNCPQGLACMANVAILLNDMFPDQKKTPLRETFKRKKEALKEAITNYGNKDVGLWCSDHIGNLFQFQDQCDSEPKGKVFKKKGCIKPLSMMVEALGDDDRITSGECRCYEMIHNGYFCTGASKACPAIEEEKKTSREPLGGREGFLMKRSKAVNTDLVAVPFDCMTNSRDLAEAMEKLAPTGYCSARQMFGQIAPAVSRTVQNKNQLSCAKSGILEERLFGESEIFMNPGCAVLDGEGGGAGGEAEPEPESEEEEIKDACKNAANPPACEAARKAGMERLRNNKEMLRQQCQRLLGGSSPQCTPGAINTAIKAAEREASTQSTHDPNPNPDTNAQYDPSTHTLEFFGNYIYEEMTWAHEGYHAAATNGGFSVITNVPGCPPKTYSCECDSTGCWIFQDHEQMARSQSPLQQPCPDCPDQCAGEDILNNAVFRCLGMGQEELDRTTPKGDPINPALNPVASPLPDDSGPIGPKLAAASQALQACAQAGATGDRLRIEKGCGSRMTPDPDNPDCKLSKSGEGDSFRSDSALCRQIDCVTDSLHPCCRNRGCPEGTVAEIGWRGVECRPESGSPQEPGTPGPRRGN